MLLLHEAKDTFSESGQMVQTYIMAVKPCKSGKSVTESMLQEVKHEVRIGIGCRKPAGKEVGTFKHLQHYMQK